jgi:hypothetical protein
MEIADSLLDGSMMGRLGCIIYELGTTMRILVDLLGVIRLDRWMISIFMFMFRGIL